MIRFVVGSLVALLAIGVGTLFIAKSVAEHAAMREAKTRGAALARVVAGPPGNPDPRPGARGRSARQRRRTRGRRGPARRPQRRVAEPATRSLNRAHEGVARRRKHPVVG